MSKVNILEEADTIVNGDRRKEYGHPKQNFADVAAMWSTILSVQITLTQVIQCLIALKLCRANQGYKRDTFIDIAGYARCAEMVNEEDYTREPAATSKKRMEDIAYMVQRE